MVAENISPVPADELFPTWRGREPYEARLPALSAMLTQLHPGLEEAVAALPFKRFEAAYAPLGTIYRYNDVPAEAATLFASVPDRLRGPWLCALLIWHISRFDEVFASTALPDEFRLHYRDAFHRILDQVEAEPSFADLDKDSFLKDLWITRGVMIPAFAQVWWPHSGVSAKSVLRAGPAAAAYVFLRCGGRRPMMEGHTHDPMAKAYWNEHGWGEALRLAALALAAMSRLRGVFGTAWFYDPAVKEVSPRLAFAQDLQVGRGAHRFKIGSNEAAIANATATSSERRRRFSEGSYVPTDYAIIWSRRDLASAYGVPPSPTSS